jgi:hypothetical protein
LAPYSRQSKNLGKNREFLCFDSGGATGRSEREAGLAAKFALRLFA